MNKEMLKPFAFMAAVVILIASTFVIVGMSSERHNIVPAETVTFDGHTYDVLDIITDSGMEQTSSELSRFNSFEELNQIVGQDGRDEVYYYWGGGSNGLMVDDVAFAMEDSGALALGGISDASYSSTNTQVAGVDEGDLVKNDANYAYIAKYDRGSVMIVKANPASEMRILSEIEMQGNVVDMYISGDYLVIIDQTYYFEGGYQDTSYMYSDKPTLIVKVYDITDRAEPVLLRDATLSGYFQTSRLIDNNLYLIASHYHYGQYENETELPLPIDCLYYIEDENAYYSLNNFMTLDITDSSSNPGVLGIYMSSANVIYVSQSNIYISHMKPYHYDEYWDWEDYEEISVIHRIGIQGKDLKYRARGEVPGWILNRYSMDEFNGHFRVATTKGWSWGAGEDQSKNLVTVLDMALNETGQLGDIAPGEQIYSARFLGDRCYLVTFRQVDPFFVIDMHDAESPQILGELKIPGYSSYLHPYDANHIIGLGKENGTVKISLFNVTDVSNPTELDNIQIGEDYSDSMALWDPHAFTFSYEKGLLVIPIWEYNYDYYSESSESGYSAMVFSISPQAGINKLATIKHPEVQQPMEYWTWDYYYYDNQVFRSFFIGDMLYTVSDMHMKATSLQNYSQIDIVELG